MKTNPVGGYPGIVETRAPFASEPVPAGAFKPCYSGARLRRQTQEHLEAGIMPAIHLFWNE
jgi:hypothetical protein